MKQPRILSRINLTVLALAALLAGTLLFAGCSTTDSSDTGASDHSGHQGSCH
jgi:outer membrane murein-binding lipoprotein Lpp